MPIFKNETELAKLLKEILGPQFKEIHTNVNLASHKFYKDWQKWWGKDTPPAQPEIDLLFVSNNLDLTAVELKYYRSGKNVINQPYYAGIDEALSLLKFGMICVGLWHFFDVDIDETIVKRYQSACSGLVNGLCLRINYEAFRVYGRNKEDFKRVCSPPYSESQAIFSTYGTSNPLCEKDIGRKSDDFIRRALRIPRQKM